MFIKDELIIGSSYPSEEKKWTKMDLIEYLGMNNEECLNSYQYQGGVNLFYKCDLTMRFVKEWFNICCKYSLLDDSPSIIPNDPSFCEHRHDQSIFSILFKKYNLKSNYTLPGLCIKVWENPFRK